MIRLDASASLAGYVLIEDGPGDTIQWCDPVGGARGTFRIATHGKAFLDFIHSGKALELFQPVDDQ